MTGSVMGHGICNLGKELNLCSIAQTPERENCTLHGTEVYLLQPALRRYA